MGLDKNHWTWVPLEKRKLEITIVQDSHKWTYGYFFFWSLIFIVKNGKAGEGKGSSSYSTVGSNNEMASKIFREISRILQNDLSLLKPLASGEELCSALHELHLNPSGLWHSYYFPQLRGPIPHLLHLYLLETFLFHKGPGSSFPFIPTQNYLLISLFSHGTLFITVYSIHNFKSNPVVEKFNFLSPKNENV